PSSGRSGPAPTSRTRPGSCGCGTPPGSDSAKRSPRPTHRIARGNPQVQPAGSSPTGHRGLSSSSSMSMTRQPVAAVIPARGGLSGIPLKNLQKVAGRSLLARAIDAAPAAQHIDDVLFSTDHEGIAQEARRAGARVIHRPDEISGYTASSESALLHV